MKKIDVNCDLGEWKTKDGALRDKAIMPFISSCNIACGGHIGDESSMRETIQLAKQFNVAVGVHPSYPDADNFGRIVMDISLIELEKALFQQIETFRKILKEEGQILHHFKLHGALYNHAAKDEETAEVMVSLVKSAGEDIQVYLPPNSTSMAVAKRASLNVRSEVFADRVYEEDLSLRSRLLPNSVLIDEVDVLNQLYSMIKDNKIRTQSGVIKPIFAETVCIHSDTQGAIQLAKTINQFLRNHGVEITSS